MDEFDTVLVTDLIGRTCEAAVDPNQWHGFADALERVYPESRITLFGHENGRPVANLAVATNLSAAALRDYTDYYAACSPYIARRPPQAVGRAFNYESVIGDRELCSTEYYNDYLRPHRLGHYGAGLVVDRHDSPFRLPHGTVISLVHHRNDADRIARQMRLLDLLGPHLRRALQLHRLIESERRRAEATQAAFDHWSHPVAVLDAAGRVVSFNRAAAALFLRADRIWLGEGGRLRTADDSKLREIERAVRRCATLDAESDDLEGITLPSSSGAPPLRAAICALAAGARRLAPEAGRGVALMLILDPAQPRRASLGWLRRQFDLLPSELRLLEAIVNGHTLAQAAEQLGIRLSTARTRMKTILTKTNCHRQVDLVRLAQSLSAVGEP
jgi:DNA-binding CsgD family transcriptional regulator/PAS domain-containing protein